MASSPLNDDVVTEIFLRLPLQSLFRFKTVCKSWRDIIDSPPFQKSYIANNTHGDDRLLILHSKLLEKLIFLTSTGKPVDDFPVFNETEPGRIVTELVEQRLFDLAGPVNGVICIANFTQLRVCNPSLGLIKSLQLHQPCPLPLVVSVGLGFDDAARNYKVVQLLPCSKHRCIHVSVYSKTTDSWRDLASVEDLIITNTIKSLGINDGRAAHLEGVRVGGGNFVNVILSFDMKSETFRVLEMEKPDSRILEMDQMPNFGRFLNKRMSSKIYAKGDAFVFFRQGGGRVITEYDARFRGDNNNTLCWDIVKKVRIRLPDDSKKFLIRLSDELICGDYYPRYQTVSWNGCVFFNQLVLTQESDKLSKKVMFYDFDDEEIVRSLEMPGVCEVYKYRGSFVQP